MQAILVALQKMFKISDIKMKPHDDIEFLTRKELAQKLKIGLTTLHEWKKKGKLVAGRDYIQIGRTVRYCWGPNFIRNLHEEKPDKNKNDYKSCRKGGKIKKGSKNNFINFEY